MNGHHFSSRNPSFFHFKLSVLHFKYVLKFSKFLKFNPITYGGRLIGFNFENFKTFLKCKTDSFKWKNEGFLTGKMVSIHFFRAIFAKIKPLQNFTPRDDIVPRFYKCMHVKRPGILIFGKVRRLSMVFPHFLGDKIE